MPCSLDSAPPRVRPARRVGGLGGWLAALLIVAGLGCVASYDHASDTTITQIQKKLDARIDAAAGGEASPESRAAFYDDVQGDVRLLRTRTEARGDDPSLRRQVGILDNLSASIADVRGMEQTAEQNPPPPKAWETAKRLVETPVKSFLAVELARK